MAIGRFEIERFSVRSSRLFETVVAALRAQVGRLDLVEFAEKVQETLIRRDLGTSALMLFLELDHGAVLRKETGLDRPKILRVIGNPLVMREMATQVPDASALP